jgi:hypothetical protein
VASGELGQETGVLYFPHMEVPADAWFSQVLLYWDRVGTIVAKSMAQEVLQSHWSGDLVAADLLKLVEVDYTVYDSTPLGGEAFLNWVRADLRAARARFRGGETSRLFVQKTGRDIAGELVGLGVADDPVETYEGDHWLEVDTVTADAFMLYLAVYLGSLEWVQMTPITDGKGLALDARLAQSVGRETAADRVGLERFLIENLLPAPSAPIPVREIVAFKENHGAEQRAFRDLVLDAAIQLREVKDPADRREQTRATVLRMQDQRDQLAARMRERRWPRIVFGGLVPFVGAVAGVLTGGATATLVASGAGLTTGAYSLAEMALVGRQRPAAPIAYAAFAQRSFGES